MFGDRRLSHAQAGDDIADGKFLQCEETQDVAAAGLGDGVEGVGGCGGTRHEETIHTHMGICQELFFGQENNHVNGARIGLARVIYSRSNFAGFASFASGYVIYRPISEG